MNQKVDQSKRRKGNGVLTTSTSVSLAGSHQANRISPENASNDLGARKKYRIAGHESFPCRYSWLPKTVNTLDGSSVMVSDEELAMVALGLGKNMVRSLRFWAQAAGIVIWNANRFSVTAFGRTLLGGGGLDPFLEDIRSLWLIHWNLSTNVQNPLLAWDFLLNRWQDPELMPTAILKTIQHEVVKYEGKLSLVTLQQHLDVFIHSYVPTRGKKGKVLEDNLDCPLVELGLLLQVSERESSKELSGRQPVYVFNREDKPEITPELFTYCLNDFWEKRHCNEATLTLSEIAHGHGSPGQIFKLPEDNVRARLETLAGDTDGSFIFLESAHLQQICRNRKLDGLRLLKAVYSRN